MSAKLSVEWPTLGMMLTTYAVFGIAMSQWTAAPWVCTIIMGIAIAQFSSLQHEVLHGHPFRSVWLNEIMVFPALMLVIPYRRFKETHLAHHRDPNLTDPYDDPESNYLDPEVWPRLLGSLDAVERDRVRLGHVAAHDEHDVGHFVGNKVQTLPGIQDTLTVITFKAF